MKTYSLKCTGCGAVYVQDYPWPRCEKCGGLLEVEYDYNSIELPRNFKTQFIKQWKYRPFFPVSRKPVTAGEGGTRLKEVGPGLYLKIEIDNPTKSFKDRGSTVEITKAVELGFDRVVVASTGNMALSVSAYSEIAGIEAITFVGSGANLNKIDMIRNRGGKIVQVDGDFNDAMSEAEKFAKMSNAFLIGDYLYRKEGQKGVFFEIIDQLGFNPPDYLFVPVGNATLISASYKAFQEFIKFKLIDRVPKIVGVQAEGAKPFVNYVKTGKLRKSSINTDADAIAVGYPTYAEQARKAIKETGGEAVTVTDQEMRDAMREIYRKAGVCAELAGASAYAAMIKHRIREGKSAVAVVSGGNI
ncbi:MAG: pyridoxal-phosphate dependent enzyme [Nitrososphaerota archaeon]|nr:pyridoxal-phosphate dependent enzyme [Nitrososphaerota archaeon]MDG6929847.1 pyridoxal-phosphate dependent enzyme [Nitrososphaerota archaeon]MDG6932902.1 pyridoxal-phosphate dependent enzyme [Nitrososphaerota archaeon]MDG6936369.1 pyridoxal-phosphate dependent enzyme [Nitrososphaerota archaeon]MDG6944368.1 pyridoxal-phosphate dependent enzyme [Nitrososphaerota archaeon]